MKNLYLTLFLLAVSAAVYAGGVQEQQTAEVRSGRKAEAYRELTPQQHYILNEGGTERPFSGEYNDHYEVGTYHCTQCGSPLYNSEAKFNSGTGWPSFDDTVPDAVVSRPDPRGFGTEIICGYCEGHLGHVFYGEGFTEKDTRHCVNSLALTFSPYKQAVFAGGCFWGIEYSFETLYGVIDAVSGYSGGSLPAPTYTEVLTGTTGHAEAVKVTYDPEVISYRELAMFFFDIHDPTQVNRQGPDIGDQYRSVLFYGSMEELETAQELIAILESNGYAAATELTPRVIFWPAEDYHQDYFKKHNLTPLRGPAGRF